jgi:adenosylmethionine-8-amino-7-oxononanoate aminotransferase
MALQYWSNTGRAGKRRIVALEHAYHGDTIGAMSVSADSPFTAAFDALRLPVLRIADAADLDELLRVKRDEIAAMIVEPLIQGAAGMIVYPVERLQRFREVCAANEVLFIADEVFTGFGRTGRMFACNHADIVPDFMCLSKGLTGGFLPLAATVCREEIYQAFCGADRTRTFFHGHSYSGNPLGCAAGVASLEIFDCEPVFERIGAIENIHKERLPDFRQHPSVADVRMLGTIAAIELRTGDAGYLSDVRDRLYRYFLKRGVLLRPLGNVVYMVPPYVISPDDLHYVYDIVKSALR